MGFVKDLSTNYIDKLVVIVDSCSSRTVAKKIHDLSLKIAVYFSADEEKESYGTILQKFEAIGNLEPLEFRLQQTFGI